MDSQRQWVRNGLKEQTVPGRDELKDTLPAETRVNIILVRLALTLTY